MRTSDLCVCAVCVCVCVCCVCVCVCVCVCTRRYICRWIEENNAYRLIIHVHVPTMYQVLVLWQVIVET